MNPSERALKAIYGGDTQKIAEIIESLEEIVKNAGFYLNDSSTPQLTLLFLKLLDRLFGEDVTTVGNVDGSVSAVVYGSWSKSVLGGWLRTFISSSFDHSSVIGAVPAIVRRGNSTILEPPSLKLLRFLFPYSSFLGIMENTRVEYQWNIDLLPVKVKQLLTNKNAIGIVDSFAATLFAKMVGNDLVAVQKPGQPPQRSLHVDSLQYFLLCLARYPTLNNHYLSKNIAPAFGATTRTTEFSTSTGPSNIEILHSKGCAAWLTSIPFLKLLSVYVEELILSSTADNARSSRSLHREFFFLIMLEYWLDQANILHHDFAFASEYRSVLANGNKPTGLLSNNAMQVHDKENKFIMNTAMLVDSVRHPHPTESVLLDQVFPRFTSCTLQSTYTLLWLMLKRLGSQPQLLLAYAQSLDDHLPERHITRSSAYNNRRRNDNSNVELKTLMHHFLLMQMPLFDMLSAIFGRQQQLDREVVSMAVEVWLLYALPWKTFPAFFSEVANPEEARLYRRLYIAFNLPFYSTLFVLFFKMMSRLNLTNSLEGQRNLGILTRVLDMFVADDNSNITQIVNTFSVSLTAWYGQQLAAQKQQPQFGNPRTPQRSRSVSTQDVSGEELRLMKDTHGRLFPDSGITALEDYGVTDFQKFSLDSARIVINSSVLIETNESILPTAIVDAIDGMATKLSNYVYDLFGLENEDGAAAVSSNSRIQVIKRRIMQLLPDLQTISSSNAGSLSGSQVAVDAFSTANIRDYGTGKLTEEGKELVQKRLIRFNPADIDSTLCDDSLNLPILNKEFDLPKDRRWSRCSWAKILQLETNESLLGLLINCFRFDLRFVSTYRFFGSFVVMVSYVLMRWRIVSVHWGVLFMAPFLYLVLKGSFPLYTFR